MYEKILEQAKTHERNVAGFLRDLIAIKSVSSQEGAVIARIEQEMRASGYDEVRIDGMGNILGRVGNGSRVLALDAHVDTVDVGNPVNWKIDPFTGAEEHGVIYGRGACDMKGALASIVYGGRIIKEMGLEGDVTLWVVGSVQEEDCDGLCWQYILREQVLRPDVVVITEPTKLGVYRGHRGRMEMEVRTQGLSCHGSAPERGVNAVYKMAPIIADIERLNERLAATADAFLGKGTVTISDIRSTSPSLCAVADSSTIHLDRRLTRGETMEHAVAEIEALESVRAAGATVSVLDYARPSYTGLTYPTKKYYPTWILEETVVGKWGFSTNGIATCGMFGIPTIGFGPGDEIYAHGPEDQCPVEHLTRAARFYAAFPRLYLEALAGRRG